MQNHAFAGCLDWVGYLYAQSNAISAGRIRLSPDPSVSRRCVLPSICEGTRQVPGVAARWRFTLSGIRVGVFDHQQSYRGLPPPMLTVFRSDLMAVFWKDSRSGLKQLRSATRCLLRMPGRPVAGRCPKRSFRPTVPGSRFRVQGSRFRVQGSTTRLSRLADSVATCCW